MNEQARDRRIYVRIPARLEAAVRDRALDATLYFLTRDLSLGGVFLQSDLLLEVGSRVALFFEIPEDLGLCRAYGEVAWTRDDEEGAVPGMGVRFQELEGDASLRLSRFIRARAGKLRNH